MAYFIFRRRGENAHSGDLTLCRPEKPDFIRTVLSYNGCAGFWRNSDSLERRVPGAAVNPVGGEAQVDQYNFEFFGKKKPSLPLRILYQILRYLLVVGFLYIAYLGFTMRRSGVTQTPQTPPVKQPAAPAGGFKNPASGGRSTPVAPPGRTGTGGKSF